MMKKVILIALCLSPLAFAQKETLTPTMLDRIDEAKLLGEIRVYVSRKVKIDYVSTERVDADTDDDRRMTRVTRRDMLREIVTRRIRGKIVEVNNPYDKAHNLPRESVFVTFDPACKVTECSYGFRRDVRRTGLEKFEEDGNKYVLFQSPARAGFETIQFKSKAYLKFKYKEFEEINRDRRKLPGVD